MRTTYIFGIRPPRDTDKHEFIEHPKCPGITIYGTRLKAGELIPAVCFFSAPDKSWRTVHSELIGMCIGENARDIYVRPSQTPFISRPTVIPPTSS